MPCLEIKIFELILLNELKQQGMNANLLDISWGNWVKSPNEFDTYVSHKGDKIRFLSAFHAVINGKVFRGFGEIHQKLLELNHKTGF